MQPDDEQALIEQAKHDPEAFGRLFDAHYRKILGYTVRRTGSVADAEDIVAVTFMKALQALPKYQWRGVSIEAWLYTIATNEIRMYFRGWRITTSLDELYEVDGYEPPDEEHDLHAELEEAEDRLARHEQYQAARTAISALPMKYQEVLTLRFDEHMKLGDIARVTGRREGTVKSLLSRGLAKLRTELQPNGGGRIVTHEGLSISTKPKEDYER